ncbi:MAG: hypothetical protein WD645_01300, partial [Dehalococcoidia bacterium]
LLRAFEAARARGLTCVSLCAAGGGAMHALDDFAVILPTNDPQRAQELHLTVVHLLCELVEQRFVKQPETDMGHTLPAVASITPSSRGGMEYAA